MQLDSHNVVHFDKKGPIKQRGYALNCELLSSGVGQMAHTAVVRFSSCVSVVDLTTMRAVKEYELDVKECPTNCFAASSKNDTVTIWASTSKGVITGYDGRSKEQCSNVATSLPVSCLSASHDGSILAFGTEKMKQPAQIENSTSQNAEPDSDDEDATQALIGFVDGRVMRDVLGVYAESHSDEISSLRFAPGSHELLASGSFDGLLNVFNLRERTEDDALVHSMNVGTTVHRIAWSPIRVDNQWSSISTFGEDSQLDVYNEEADSVLHRIEIEQEDLHESDNQRYGIGLFYTDADNLYSCWTRHNGELVLENFNVQKKKYKSICHFDELHSSMIRCCVYDPIGRLLVTGDESGVVQVSLLTGQDDVDTNEKSSKKKSRKRPQPY